MLKRVSRQPAVQVCLAGLLGLYLDLALRTTRWQIDGWEHMQPHAAGAPAIAAFWHERLAMMPMLWQVVSRRGLAAGFPTRAHVLVSRHRDGRFIAAVLRRFNADVVYGSSSRGGASGLRAMLAVLATGEHVVITPDGPRGPRRQAAPGVGQLAALSGVPVLPCAAQTTRRRVLSSWDRMVLPLPFGRGALVCGPPISVPSDAGQAAIPAIALALDLVAERADRLCAQ